MPNYQNGKIYKIESLIGNCIYYGSTIQKLCVRMAGHRCNNISSMEVLQYHDAKIYLVELYPCNSKEELNAREGWYIRNNNCVNKNIPGRDNQEYYQDNKDRIKLQTKKYYNENKEVIYRRVKQYKFKHEHKIQKYQKQYKIINKEKLNQYNKQKVICECGSEITKYNYNRHKKSVYHINLMNNPFYNMKL